MSDLVVELNRPFHPTRAFRTKLFLYIGISFCIISSILLAGLGVGSFILLFEEGNDFGPFGVLAWVTERIFFLNEVIIFLYVIFTILWAGPSIILSFYYVKQIEYSLTTTEVIIRKGIINKTVKHIPLRTITNVSSRSGILDRFLGIGTVEIETAGKSGRMAGPEGKIEGIHHFQRIREIILTELRGFTTSYVTTTETPRKLMNDDIQYHQAFLRELLEIKQILEE